MLSCKAKCQSDTKESSDSRIVGSKHFLKKKKLGVSIIQFVSSNFLFYGVKISSQAVSDMVFSMNNYLNAENRGNYRKDLGEPGQKRINSLL